MNLPISISLNKKKRQVLCFGLLFLLLAAGSLLGICAGSVKLSVGDILAAVRHSGQNPAAEVILFQIRMPRVLAAVFLGGALALSGYLLQTFFQNPIAGPFVLGISSGAKLFVALLMVLFFRWGYALTSWSMVITAFAGSMLSMFLVLLFSGKVKSMSFLVLIGVMIGYICSAVTDFVVTFAADSDIVNLHNWSMGSFSGIGWENIQVIIAVVTAASIGAFLLSKPINAYQMGEAYAQNMGVNIRIFRAMLVVLSSILSAVVVAFAGPVSFVGIAVPQMVKWLFQSAKPLVIIPASFLGGAVFCLFCDLLARTLFAPTELSISTVTAIFGAPVVILVMLHRKR